MFLFSTSFFSDCLWILQTVLSNWQIVLFMFGRLYVMVMFRLICLLSSIGNSPLFSFSTSVCLSLSHSYWLLYVFLSLYISAHFPMLRYYVMFVCAHSIWSAYNIVAMKFFQGISFSVLSTYLLCCCCCCTESIKFFLSVCLSVDVLCLYITGLIITQCMYYQHAQWHSNLPHPPMTDYTLNVIYVMCLRYSKYILVSWFAFYDICDILLFLNFDVISIA
jgi:hypothetical protein